MKFPLDKLSYVLELEDIFDKLRVLSAKNNEFATRCLGSGNCCDVGLTIPQLESYRIAFNIHREYMDIYDDRGAVKAAEYKENIINNLTKAMHRDKWTWEQNYPDDGEKCAFFEGGCTIHKFRPVICAAYGTITNVDSYCPRERTESGQVIYFKGAEVHNIILDYKKLLQKWGKKYPKEAFVTYMPTAILRYLLPLPHNTLQRLVDTCDPKFFLGTETYKLALFQDLERENGMMQSGT